MTLTPTKKHADGDLGKPSSSPYRYSASEAKANEASDKEAKEKVEKVNQADSMIFQTEKQLKEYGDKIGPDKKAPIEAALTKLKDAHKQQNISAIDTAIAEMNAAWTAASEEMYKASQADQAGGPQQPQGDDAGANRQGQGGQAENVTDAEFEEVK